MRLIPAENLSWFDALIVEAAARAGCERLYSADLDDGRQYDDTMVSNPFRIPESSF